MVYAYVSNFIRISLLCRHRGAKNPKFYWIFSFNILCWRHLLVQRQSWMHMHNNKPSPSNGVKITFILKRLDGEVISINSTIHNKKHRTFRTPIQPPAEGERPSPAILRMVIEEVCTFLAPQKLHIRCTVLQLGENASPTLNSHNSGTPWANPPNLNAASAHKCWKFHKNWAWG